MKKTESIFDKRMDALQNRNLSREGSKEIATYLLARASRKVIKECCEDLEIEV